MTEQNNPASILSRLVEGASRLGTRGNSYAPTAAAWILNSGLWAAPATRAMVQGDYLMGSFMAAASLGSAVAAIPKIGTKTVRAVQTMVAQI